MKWISKLQDIYVLIVLNENTSKGLEHYLVQFYLGVE